MALGESNTLDHLSTLSPSMVLVGISVVWETYPSFSKDCAAIQDHCGRTSEITQGGYN